MDGYQKMRRRAAVVGDFGWPGPVEVRQTRQPVEIHSVAGRTESVENRAGPRLSPNERSGRPSHAELGEEHVRELPDARLMMVGEESGL